MPFAGGGTRHDGPIKWKKVKVTHQATFEQIIGIPDYVQTENIELFEEYIGVAGGLKWDDEYVKPDTMKVTSVEEIL